MVSTISPKTTDDVVVAKLNLNDDFNKQFKVKFELNYLIFIAKDQLTFK